MNKYKSLQSSNIKNLFKISKKVKKTSKKKFIIFDMINCCFKYQSSFEDYLEFEFYSLTKEQRETYLTCGKNKKIIEMFNNKDYFHILNNKDEFNDYFKSYLNRDYLKPNSTKEEFYRFIKDKEKIIIKQLNGEKIVDTKNINYDDIKEYLLEDVIIQNKKLAELYDKSINSLQIFTFFDGKKAYLLQAILKIGNDNFSNSKIYAFLDEKGSVATPAIDENDNIFGIHPISKKQILGFKVPMFNEAIELVLKASTKIPEIGYISWNVAITENDPAIIEGNSYPDVFQIKPRFSKNKTGILPKYEKIMNIKL